jgi:general L-amino acid transport system substrate-binding protein
MKPVVFEKQEAATGAYFSGRCATYTTDASGLASTRNRDAKDPKEHVILPELISKEPLAPAVRRGDDEFEAIAKWVIYGLIEAEEYDVTQANVDQMKTSTDPVVMRIVGSSEDMGKLLGLDKDWLVRAIKTTGKLRRDLRPQRRRQVAPQPAARAQQPVEQRRHPVRPSHPIGEGGGPRFIRLRSDP